MSNGRILVVDDEPNLLRMLGYALSNEGYQVIGAKHGAEALHRVQTHQPDLVILDVMLPDMSGVEICQRLRQSSETANIPIIMLSARAQVSDKVEGLEAGADEYVTKPVELEEIVARVAALLKRTERLRQTPSAKRKKVIGFMGVKGGVGTTTVALNVALALTKHDQSVTAVELRPYAGTFSFHLDWSPTEGLTDLLNLEPKRIDDREVSMRLAQHASGLRILFGPQDHNVNKVINPAQVNALVKSLANLADYTILDLPSLPLPTNQAALRQCDLIAIVLEPEPTAVKSGKIMLDLLNTWGLTGKLVGAIVVNQALSGSPMKLSDIGSGLGCKIVKVIPPAAEICMKALEVGAPIVLSQSNHVVATALTELADRLIVDKVLATIAA